MSEIQNEEKQTELRTNSRGTKHKKKDKKKPNKDKDNKLKEGSKIKSRNQRTKENNVVHKTIDSRVEKLEKTAKRYSEPNPFTEQNIPKRNIWM